MGSLSSPLSCWPCSGPKGSKVDQSIQEKVAATLTELGLPAPTSIIQTMLLHDGYFVGHKLRYDGGHSIVRAGGGTIELYDEQGTLLKTVGLGTEQEAA